MDMVLFLDQSLWTWVNPNVSFERLLAIEQAISRARLLSLLRMRMDEDAT